MCTVWWSGEAETVRFRGLPALRAERQLLLDRTLERGLEEVQEDL